jgi:hypothetical protein
MITTESQKVGLRGVMEPIESAGHGKPPPYEGMLESYYSGFLWLPTLATEKSRKDGARKFTGGSGFLFLVFAASSAHKNRGVHFGVLLDLRLGHRHMGQFPE